MTLIPKFAPVQTPRGWCVSVPPSVSQTGERRRRYFPTEAEARKFAAEVKREFSRGARISALDSVMANQAVEASVILAGSGISLIEAARLAIARTMDPAGAETFGDRYARALIEGESRWSNKYRGDMELLHRWVAPWFLQVPCARIDRAEIERALTDGRVVKRSTIDHRVRYVNAVLGFRERHRKSSDIAILSVSDCARLLRACESPEERRAVALLLFAGIRPDAEHGEIRRLDWEDVGENEIYVSREVSKVSDRHIPILPRLARLIRGHPKSGPVVPANWKKVWQRLRKSAGITGQDVTRHTFGSMLLAYYDGDDGKTKLAMGHSAGSSMLLRHYRRAVLPEVGKRYFAKAQPQQAAPHPPGDV